MNDQIVLKDVKTSKLKIDEGVGQIIISFNITHFKKCGGSLDELVVHLNKLADVSIDPIQQDVMFDNKEAQSVKI